MSSKLYEVEDIVNRRWRNGKYEYLIKWKGYAKGESTWEPLSHLTNVKEMVDDFDKKMKGKKPSPDHSLKKRKEEGIKIYEDTISLREDDEEVSSNNEVIVVDNIYNRVRTVKQKNGELIAIVEKKEKNNKNECNYQLKEVNTKELRKINPLILIDFYESKIKFTKENN